eukprot:jgi/Ulvmu1/9378/UM051_0005.1
MRLVKEGPVAEICSDDPQHIVSAGGGEPSTPASKAHSTFRKLESAEVPASPVDTGAGGGSGGSSRTGLIAAVVAAVLAAVCS